MRVAVVDIGTNSPRLLVASLENGRVTDELHFGMPCSEHDRLARLMPRARR